METRGSDLDKTNPKILDTRKSLESYFNRPNSSWRKANPNMTYDLANEEVCGINREQLMRSEMGIRRPKDRESRCSNKSSELRRTFKNFPLHYTYNVYLCSDEEEM